MCSIKFRSTLNVQRRTNRLGHLLKVDNNSQVKQALKKAQRKTKKPAISRETHLVYAEFADASVTDSNVQSFYS